MQRENLGSLRPPVIFAGMHRSGTSFVASFAREAGIDIGSRLVEASRGNELGHFENVDFVQFHQRQLTLLGYAPAGWIAGSELMPGEQARLEAAGIIAENARTTPWGWKDPRATLFLDFWRSVVPAAHFVLIYREPAEVVTSLFRRGDQAIRLCPESAARSWLSHNANILRFVRAYRKQCILTNVSAIVENPGRFLELMSARFGIDINVDASSTFQERLLHLEPTGSPFATLLRHFNSEVAEVYKDLEHEADLPASAVTLSHRDASDAFFEHWLNATDDSLEQALNLERTAREHERQRNERLLARISELEERAASTQLSE